jgi:hypothetical protein
MEEAYPNSWTKDATVNGANGIFEWKSHGWVVELTMEKLKRDQTVVWKCTSSNMQNTDAWEGSVITFERFAVLGHLTLALESTT